MVRALISFGILLIANAVGLAVAAWILDGMTIDGVAFVTAVLIFSVVGAIAQPFFTSMAMKNASALRGGTALVTTLVGLIITVWLSNGLTISGLSTWIAATVIVWLAALLAGLIIPLFVGKKVVEEARS